MRSKQRNNSVCERLPPLSAKYPWFVAQNLEAKYEEDIRDKLFYTIHEPLSQYRCRIPEFRGKHIRACFHGWVILCDYPHNVNVMWSLWNPNTSKLIRLPPLKKKLRYFDECCLSTSPDDPRSMFMLTTNKKPTIVLCQLDCKTSNPRWIEMSYTKEFRSLTNGVDGSLCNLTCCNGKVYALSLAKNQVPHVIEVDIVVTDKQVVINLLKLVSIPHACFNKCPQWIIYPGVNYFLKGSCTDLFCIAIGYEDKIMRTVADMYLSKLNMTSMTWEEMKDLKDAIFFIKFFRGKVSIYYRQEIASKFGGYIHIMNEMDTVIYSYNINYRTLSISSMPQLVQTSQVSSLVMLERRLEGDHHADSEQQEDERDDRILVRSVKDHAFQINGPVDESHLLNIPFHVLEMIMDLCVGVEYMKFRATCRHYKHQGIITFTDPMLGDNYFIKTPQELIGSQIYCSRYGWLLMYKIDGALVFFNPFTNDVRELPHVSHLDSFCFSAPPTSPNCMVVGFRLIEDLHIYIHFLAGEPSWQIINLDPYDFRFPTFCGGDLYVLCDKHFFRQTYNNKGIHVFKNMGQEDNIWESVTDEAPKSCCTTRAKRFLAKCDKHCFLVVMGEFGKSIEVFNLNDSKNEWEKVDGLGKHMIYISSSTCLCVEAKAPHMENKIYFPRLHSGKIVFYSLETCRYHTFNGKMVEESLVDLTETEYHTNPHVWIEPSWS
ncbi:hypothetical protein CTI12_AA407020 [Artemisia annua]|uniref:KIB1-4 beta-propeller domain-containing protein n=1 Tax=Artemisia annua TaxID=35608 RepID=A0A2U1M8X5_ARTAN|nr:hypothetical protein CTI12_AA407020 [Artemisia annua]